MRLTVVNTTMHRMIVHAIVFAQSGVRDRQQTEEQHHIAPDFVVVVGLTNDSLDRPDELARRREARRAKIVDFPFRSARLLGL
jgi:hypothetical protein